MDKAAFAELASIMGDAMTEIINTYLDTSPDLITAIGDHIGADNAQGLFESAHRLKSASGSLGATAVADAAETLELIGREGSTQGAAERLVELETAFADAAEFLRQQL